MQSCAVAAGNTLAMAVLELWREIKYARLTEAAYQSFSYLKSAVKIVQRALERADLVGGYVGVLYGGQNAYIIGSG